MSLYERLTRPHEYLKDLGGATECEGLWFCDHCDQHAIHIYEDHYVQWFCVTCRRGGDALDFAALITDSAPDWREDQSKAKALVDSVFEIYAEVARKREVN